MAKNDRICSKCKYWDCNECLAIPFFSKMFLPFWARSMVNNIPSRFPCSADSQMAVDCEVFWEKN